MKKLTTSILVAMVLLLSTTGAFAMSMGKTHTSGNLDDIYVNNMHDGR